MRSAQPSTAAKLAARKKLQHSRRQQQEQDEDDQRMFEQQQRQRAPQYQQQQQQQQPYSLNDHQRPPASVAALSAHASSPASFAAAASSPVFPAVAAAPDADSTRQWSLMQASLLCDSLARIQQMRDQDSARLSRALSAPSLDAAARSQLLTAFALGEEWRVVSEDALLVRVGRSPYFASPSGAARLQPRESALARFMRSKAAARERIYPAGPHLFVDASGRPALPDPIFAASALEALQSPPSLSGLRSEEVQLALQLTLEQMSSRVLVGLVQPPVASFALSAGSSSSSSARHPLLILLSELEQCRWDAARLVTPLAAQSSSALVSKLRRAYSASIIQRSFRLARSRKVGRSVRKKLVEARSREQEQARRERELHCVRVLQASLRARIASHELRATLARESRLIVAAARIAHWWLWRRRVRGWNATWSRTAKAKSLLHQRGGLSPQQMRGIVRAQSLWRGALLRKRLPFLRTMAAHRARRTTERLWSRKQAARARISAIESALVESSLQAHRDCQRADEESDSERARLAAQYESWHRKMRRYFFQTRPLPKHWLPQLDRHSGRTYYFNLKSGEISQQHPLEPAVRELEKQESAKAQQILQHRLQALREFKTARQQQAEEQRAQGLQTLAKLQRFVA